MPQLPPPAAARSATATPATTPAATPAATTPAAATSAAAIAAPADAGTAEGKAGEEAEEAGNDEEDVRVAILERLLCVGASPGAGCGPQLDALVRVGVRLS